MSARPASSTRWLLFALSTVVLWGVWGALSSLSGQHGFPDTLVYCVWALTMVPPALIVLGQAGWKLDRAPKAVVYGLLIGLLGAGGQMVLFYAVTRGPTYLIFPIISLSPLVTILLSTVLLRERTGKLGLLGIVLALAALPAFDFAPGGAHGGGDWFLLALVITACWGLQAYLMKTANSLMSAESIFFYMTVTGLMLVPVAAAMTNWSARVNWGLDGPWLCAAIQVLNAIGALTLVFAFRHGKAIIVAPLTNAGAPLVTAVLALLIAGVVPGPLKMAGIGLALAASLLLAIEPAEDDPPQSD